MRWINEENKGDFIIYEPNEKIKEKEKARKAKGIQTRDKRCQCRFSFWAIEESEDWQNWHKIANYMTRFYCKTRDSSDRRNKTQQKQQYKK